MQVAVLTEKQKAAIRLRLAQIPQPERLALLRNLKAAEDVPADVVVFVESVISALQAEASRGAAHPAEAPSKVPAMSPEEVRAFWASVGHLGLAVSVGGGIIAGFVYVVIPAAIAVGKAAIVAAPYVAGAAVCGFGLVSFVQSLRRPDPAAEKPAEPEVLVRTTTITETFRQ